MEKSLGIFDSGIGGLTVLKEIIRVLPNETTIYLGDTARVPYGTKSASTIRRYAIEDAQFLIDQGIKLLVVACNTASANATSYLRDRLDIPIVEVIQPGSESCRNNPYWQSGRLAQKQQSKVGHTLHILHLLTRPLKSSAKHVPFSFHLLRNPGITLRMKPTLLT